jgi:hypothetical protein
MDVRKMLEELAAPLPPEEVKWKAQATKGARALAVPYVTSRAVQDHLDKVVGPVNWCDVYRFLKGGTVACGLSLRLGDEWITKWDVGGESEQPDEGDRHKAAVSDSLKRAAVKWGIARYLYRLPKTWVDYDDRNKQIVKPPPLPAWALPKGAPGPEVQGAAARVKPKAPKDGKEFLQRLRDRDALLVREGICQAGELVKAVRKAGTQAGFGHKIEEWAGPAITVGYEEVKAFEARCRRDAEKAVHEAAEERAAVAGEAAAGTE